MKNNFPWTHLSAQLEVDHKHRYLGARYHEDEKDDEEETKEVVDLVLPDGREDEEKLDEHCSERQHSGDQSTDQTKIELIDNHV